MAERVEFKPLAPKEAIDYFRKKGYKTTFDHQEMQREEHLYHFTVAKATSIDILQDIRRSVDEAISEGQTFDHFKTQLKPTLESKGWWGRKIVRDPSTGEDREVQLGSPRRLKIIFDTNLRTAYAAGRWEQIQKTKRLRPYLRYLAVLDGRTRPQHRQFNNIVKPADDPFWNEHFPPNGWRCRCTVQQLSERDLERLGLDVTPGDPVIERRAFEDKRTGEVLNVPRGIDPGFAYNVGKERMKAMVPPLLDQPLPRPYFGLPGAVPPPPPRPLPEKKILPDDLEEQEYVRRFMKEFGGDIGKPVIFTDVTGERLVISDELFRDKAGKFKVKKRGRHIYTLLLAEAIKSPDEVFWVWREYPAGRWTLNKVFLANWIGEKDVPAFTMFDTGSSGWTGITSFSPDKSAYLGKQRSGAMVYRRPEKK